MVRCRAGSHRVGRGFVDAGWRKAVRRRTGGEYSSVYGAFYATSGRVPRYLHIWPYGSLEQRLDVRTRAVADGAWPPENSAPQLLDMHSTIYVPADFPPWHERQIERRNWVHDSSTCRHLGLPVRR